VSSEEEKHGTNAGSKLENYPITKNTHERSFLQEFFGAVFSGKDGHVETHSHLNFHHLKQFKVPTIQRSFLKQTKVIKLKR
jgi:hypothetical protein